MLYLPLDPTPRAVFYHTTQVCGAFTDLLVLRGRTDYFDSILDRCFRLSVLAALTEWIHKARARSSVVHACFYQGASQLTLFCSYFILVKAPLRVLYDKIQHEGWGRVANTARGEAECFICHKTTPRVLYFIIQHS